MHKGNIDGRKFSKKQKERQKSMRRRANLGNIHFKQRAGLLEDLPTPCKPGWIISPMANIRLLCAER